MRPLLNQWLGVEVCACHPQLLGEAQIGGSWSSSPDIKGDPILTIASTKRAGDLVQVVEHLPCKPQYHHQKKTK
jgi:hypothetical protein